MARVRITTIVGLACALGACRYHAGDYTTDAPSTRPDALEVQPDGPPGPDAVADAAIDARQPVTVTFGEAPGTDHSGVTTDAYLESANPGANHGADTILWADASPVNNALLRFDLSAIPPGATVTAADLVLTTTLDLLEDGTVQVYPALEQWADAGSSWNDRATGTPWTDAGASPPSSRSTFMIAEFAPNIAATPFTVPLAAGTVQTWIDTPTTNFGVVLISTSPGGHGTTFISSDDGINVIARPLLRITYQ